MAREEPKRGKALWQLCSKVALDEGGSDEGVVQYACEQTHSV